MSEEDSDSESDYKEDIWIDNKHNLDNDDWWLVINNIVYIFFHFIIPFQFQLGIWRFKILDSILTLEIGIFQLIMV